MRIGVACNKFGQSGGMEQYALNLIEALIQLGHTPVIFTMRVDSSITNFPEAEVHICPYVSKWLPNKINIQRFNNWLRSIRNSIHIDLLIACCLAVTAEIATCGGTHIGYRKVMKRCLPFLDSIIINIERDLYSNAKLVIAHSEAMKHELISFYGINPEKIKVLYPPQTFSVLNEDLDKKELRKKFGLPEKKTLFLFPSSSHRRKGIHLLRDYFENTTYPELLVIAGKPLQSSFKNSLELGFCHEMQLLYHACDYTVLASLYEPLGMVGAESVCCGTPVLLGNNIGCCEILSEKAIRTFDVTSVEDFSKIMASIRQNPIHLEKPYQQYVKACGNMSNEQHLTEILSLYS